MGSWCPLSAPVRHKMPVEKKLACKRGDHMIVDGAGLEEDIHVPTFHVSCRSDKVEETVKHNYIGFILYKYNNQTKWELNGVRCRSGYIYITNSANLPATPNSTAHGRAFAKLFSLKDLESLNKHISQVVASGFAFKKGVWEEKSSTFNSNQKVFARSNNREGVEEMDLVKKAIRGWSREGSQNCDTAGWQPTVVTVSD